MTLLHTVCASGQVNISLCLNLSWNSHVWLMAALLGNASYCYMFQQPWIAQLEKKSQLLGGCGWKGTMGTSVIVNNKDKVLKNVYVFWPGYWNNDAEILSPVVLRFLTIRLWRFIALCEETLFTFGSLIPPSLSPTHPKITIPFLKPIS